MDVFIVEINELEQYQHVYILKTLYREKHKLHKVTFYMLIHIYMYYLGNLHISELIKTCM